MTADWSISSHMSSIAGLRIGIWSCGRPGISGFDLDLCLEPGWRSREEHLKEIKGRSNPHRVKTFDFIKGKYLYFGYLCFEETPEDSRWALNAVYDGQQGLCSNGGGTSIGRGSGHCRADLVWPGRASRGSRSNRSNMAGRRSASSCASSHSRRASFTDSVECLLSPAALVMKEI